MFGSTMEMTDIRAMKTCIALRLLIETDLGSQAWIRVGGKLIRGSEQHSQSGQTLVQRDMNPQHATVD
ncbi:hypothetical protein CK203_055760 [Vitis vinifera]|uniref:Uncharacterized protein n=1 Tax=Vitis vinifera TaxID=29760 RepID=A0A438H130_VITVI|nr:hypothetical protein CK203_055760 [Vitis vinifera]